MLNLNEQNRDVYAHFAGEKKLQEFFEESLEHYKTKAIVERDRGEQLRACGAAECLALFLANIKKVKT